MSAKTNHVFVWERPGHDLDGEEFSVYATEHEASERASTVSALYRCRLVKIGTRCGGVLTPCVPTETLPWWAAEQIKKGAA